MDMKNYVFYSNSIIYTGTHLRISIYLDFCCCFSYFICRTCCDVHTCLLFARSVG